MCSNLFRYFIKQKDSMLQCVCSVIDHKRRQNVVRTLNGRTATWNLFVKLILLQFLKKSMPLQLFFKKKRVKASDYLLNYLKVPMK